MKKAFTNSFGLARQRTQERMGNAVVTQDPEVEAQTKVRADSDAGCRRMRLRSVKSAATVGFVADLWYGECRGF